MKEHTLIDVNGESMGRSRAILYICIYRYFFFSNDTCVCVMAAVVVWLRTIYLFNCLIPHSPPEYVLGKDSRAA